MKLAGDFRFDAPRDLVWEALLDPNMLAQTLPGCDALDKDGDEYVGELNIKIGPVQGKFKGKVLLSDIESPDRYRMTVDGRGAPGFVKATATVALHDDGDATRMEYDSDVKVGGRIASVGQRLLDVSARAIVKQSLAALDAQLQAKAAQRTASAVSEEAPSEEAPAEEAPSHAGGPAPRDASPSPPPKVTQAEFAAGVAREMAKDLFPPRTVAIIVVALLGLLLWLLIRF